MAQPHRTRWLSGDELFAGRAEATYWNTEREAQPVGGGDGAAPSYRGAGSDAAPRATVSRQGMYVTSGIDQTVGVWDETTGRELRTFLVEEPADALALSADGRWLAAGDPSVAHRCGKSRTTRRNVRRARSVTASRVCRSRRRMDRLFRHRRKEPTRPLEYRLLPRRFQTPLIVRSRITCVLLRWQTRRLQQWTSRLRS
jgi:hypothetical protein